MKKIFRKNQIIITSLVMMIAAAGYLNYTGQLPSFTLNSDIDNFSDISEEDMVNKSIDGDEEAGEAVLTSATKTSKGAVASEGAVDSSAQGAGSTIAKAKLNKEQARSKEKETLQSIIDNGKLKEAEKQAAIDKIIQLADRTEKENLIESLVMAKGFEAVVIISEDQVNIIINKEALEEEKRAQIENIVMDKTQLPIEQIVITPIK